MLSACGITDFVSSSVRPSVSFCFRLLLFLEFIFDHSDFFLPKETGYI